MNEIIETKGTLIFDSWIDDLPELRGDNIEDRHLIYEGGGIILDLLIKMDETRNSLHVGGQVLPEGHSLDDVSDLRVSIEHGKGRSHTYTNALGEFAFHTVPNGTLDLAITLKDRRFTVYGLSNKEPRLWRIVPSMALGGD